MEPESLIRELKMAPHPEGGHYVETFRDRPPGGGRGALTCIHFLLQAGEVSAWHRVDVTEVWHFAAGAPLFLNLSPDGHDATAHHLGPDILSGQEPHVVVPPGCWQTARSLGAWTLVSCIVAPAFQFEGFELAAAGWRPAPPAEKHGRRSLTTGGVPRTKSAMRASTTPLIAPALASVLLAGCAFTGGVPDRLEDKIQGYYAAHAVEEGGECGAPEMASMTRRKVVASSAERTVLRVRYSYFDSSEGTTPAWPLVLDGERACTGSAEREFTLERGKLGYAVVDMSGPTRAE